MKTHDSRGQTSEVLLFVSSLSMLDEMRGAFSDILQLPA